MSPEMWFVLIVFLGAAFVIWLILTAKRQLEREKQLKK